MPRPRRSSRSGRKSKRQTANNPPPRSTEETLQYLRVKLEPNSNEFKQVERLFRETMTDDKIITSVERVENLFLRDKFFRALYNSASNLQQLSTAPERSYDTSATADRRHCTTQLQIYNSKVQRLEYLMLQIYNGKVQRPGISYGTSVTTDGSLYDSASDLQPQSTAAESSYGTSVTTYRALFNSASNLQQQSTASESSYGTSVTADRLLHDSASNLQQPIAAPESSQGHLANPEVFNTSANANRTLSSLVSNLRLEIITMNRSQGNRATPRVSGTTATANRALSNSVSNLQQQSTVPESS
ncbi:hypothetical protein OS493_031627 [Desmophyllum pertusum]|uniref:Uncharacterized protein n=1 Tax=Desmophyllum pertusum TaxID=174260 RepID=A0A9W9Y8D4_9CNID|nr:hypothetical protein OS493_031627 [Desmophyllum pertusum]